MFTAVKFAAVFGQILLSPDIVTVGIGFATIVISAEDLQSSFPVASS